MATHAATHSGPSLPVLAAVIACWCGSSASAATQEPAPPLVVNEYDTVYLKGTEPQGIVGRVVERLPDGGVRIIRFGTNDQATLAGAKIDHIERKQTAAEAVNRHGAWALAAGDWGEVKKTVKWGVDHAAKDESIALAKQALAKKPTSDLAEAVVPLLIDGGDAAGAVTICRTVLAGNPQWTFGYQSLAKIYLEQKNEAELKSLMAQWLDKQPTNPAANRFLAESAEAVGDLRTAQEAWRKPFELNKDYEAGLGYARTSLKRGMRADAQTVAETLIAANQFVFEAKAILGSALLGQNQIEKAEPVLNQALTGTLSPASTEMVKYNLGLIAFRSGRADDARKWWTGLAVPAAELGMAMLDHRPAPAKQLPAPLAGIAAEYNACLDLQNLRFDEALASLDAKGSRRQQFLAQIAAIRNPTEDAVRALAQTQSAESLRWQAFGHILARRYPQAEAALAQLPPNDGYAAVYRVYIAEAQKDSAGARALFAAVAHSDNPPAEYVAILEREYSMAEDQHLVEKFEAPVSDLQTRGWQIATPGTNIAIRTVDGSLVMEGTQTAAEDPISRAWTEHPAAAMRSLQATFDVSQIASAICGIELLDAPHKNGIAYAVLTDNRLGWRELHAGTWGEWVDLPSTVAGNLATLRLEQDRGRVTAISVDETGKRETLATGLFKDQQALSASVFGTAEAGVPWKVAIKDYQVQLRSTGRSPTSPK
ncbi:MAG: hypothetical protein H0W83_09135 [Planctomycetes bacterium]|nr:hypothetical protein [Planctomycetota bacterium]